MMVVPSGGPSKAVNAATVSSPGGIVKVRVVGAPSGNRGKYLLSSRTNGNYQASFRFRNAATGLRQGRYKIVMPTLYESSGKWVPNKPTNTVTVKSKKTTVVNISYRKVATSGSLTVKFVGVPTGKKGLARLKGPKGFKRTLSKSTTLKGLAPGKYQLLGTDIALADNTVALALSSNGSPIVLPGEVTKVTIGWNSRKSANLVVPAEPSISSSSVINGTGTLTVTDPAPYKAGYPVLIPATNNSRQQVVLVTRVIGNSVEVEPGTVYDALPVIDVSYRSDLPVATDPSSVRIGGVSSSSLSDVTLFGQPAKAKWECEDSAMVVSDLSPELTPILQVREATFKWNVFSWDVIDGPERAAAVVRTGITRKMTAKLQAELSHECAATLSVAVPVMSAGPVVFYLRGSLGLETAIKVSASGDGDSTASSSYWVDWGARYTRETGLTHVWKPSSTSSFTGRGFSSWASNTTVDYTAGVSATLSISPFESEREVEKWGFSASADLQLGVDGRIGLGQRVTVAPQAVPSNGVMLFRLQPYWYASSGIFFKASASAKAWKVGKTFKIEKFPVKFIDKEFEPIGNGWNVPVPYTGPTPTIMTTTTTNPPTTKASSVSLGAYHSCVLTVAGAVKCWGNNSSGQLGDGTSGSRSVPTQVSRLTSGVSQISVGQFHSCALTASGSVMCWGANSSGRLGNGSLTFSSVPVGVTDLASGVSQISVGGGHACALTSTGGVKCWGRNSYGQVGDGTRTDRLIPTQVSGLTSGVSQISAVGEQTCALLVTGAVKCWGYNEFGQVGDGTRTDRLIPTQVSGLTSGVSQVVAEGSYTCALLTSGAAVCWGYNQTGQLGDGTRTGRLVPTQVSGLSSGVVQISSRGYTTCALLVTGAVRCWGTNVSGQIGDGTKIDRLIPTQVNGLTSGVAQIGTGSYHACAVLMSGSVSCWGDNLFGQLGDGTSTASPRSVPARVLHLG